MSFCAFSWKKSWCRLISWCTSMEGIFHKARHKFCKCRKVSSFDSRKMFAKNAWNLWLHDKRMGGHFKDVSSIRFVIQKSTQCWGDSHRFDVSFDSKNVCLPISNSNSFKGQQQDIHNVFQLLSVWLWDLMNLRWV